MAVAEIIGAAVGVLLLVVVAYLLVGGTLATAETVVNAQKDLTLMQESRLRTSIEISDVDTITTPLVVNFSITNSGQETISDLPHMDVFSYDGTNGYVYYSYVEGIPPGSLTPDTMTDYTWTDSWYENDNIHARQLDPDVTMRVMVKRPAGLSPSNIQVTTSNGVTAIWNT